MCHSIPVVRGFCSSKPSPTTAPAKTFLGPGQRLTPRRASRWPDTRPSPVWPTTQASAASLSISNATVLSAWKCPRRRLHAHRRRRSGALPVAPLRDHQALAQASRPRLDAPLPQFLSRRSTNFAAISLGVNVSIGTVHNVVHDAIDKARTHNHAQNPRQHPCIAGLDEIFQNRQLRSRRCRHAFHLLLFTGVPKSKRDGDTWALRLMECQDRGLRSRRHHRRLRHRHPRAGQKRAMPGTPCRGDVFHARHELTPVVALLENRACDAITAHDKLERQKTKAATTRPTRSAGPTRLVKPQARRRRCGASQVRSRWPTTLPYWHAG